MIHVLETGDATGWLRASEGQNPVQGATACCARMALPSSSTPPVLGAAGDAGGGRPLTSSWRTAGAPPPEAASPVPPLACPSCSRQAPRLVSADPHWLCLGCPPFSALRDPIHPSRPSQMVTFPGAFSVPLLLGRRLFPLFPWLASMHWLISSVFPTPATSQASLGTSEDKRAVAPPLWAGFLGGVGGGPLRDCSAHPGY